MRVAPNEEYKKIKDKKKEKKRSFITLWKESSSIIIKNLSDDVEIKSLTDKMIPLMER